jgi:hypothetical protein
MASASFSDLLKAAEDAGFSNCPPGTYDVRVVAGEAKTTSAGKDMIVVKFEIIGGPHGGRKVPNNFVISPENANALGFFFRHMRAMGLDSAYFAQNPSPQKLAADLVGRTCRIEVGTRVWNGEEREDVKKIMAAEGGAATPSPMTDGQSTSAPVTPFGAADPMAPPTPF